MHTYAFIVDGRTTYFRLVPPITEFDPNFRSMTMVAADRAVGAEHLTRDESKRGLWLVAHPTASPIDL